MKEKIKKGKEFIKDPKKRAILFLGFYLIFFVILIAMVRTAPKKDVTTDNTAKPTPTPTESGIPPVSDATKNYQYIYSIKEEGKTTIYNGRRYQNKELFTMIENGATIYYYRLGENYLKKVKGSYQTTDNPYGYTQFMDLNKLKELLENEKPSRKEGNKSTYSIDVITMFSVYYPEITYDGFSILDVADTTLTVTKENNVITKVEFFLDSFIKYQSLYTNNKRNSLQITLEYYDYGQVKDFDIE